ncbi:MAG: DoxX family protein [Crocinitomicaceae bacterium]
MLIFRAVLVYGFFSPALYKISDFAGTASWFESLGMPLPSLNAYLAGITEFAGVILLTLGLGTRLISFPLIITMIVAIFTVHIGNGFPAIHNGIEIPLYFIFMLLTLMVYGPGKLSIDYLIQRRKK